MPCESIQTSQIDLGAVVPAVLDAAVTALGFAGQVSTGSTVYGSIDGRRVQLRYTDGALSVSGGADVDSVTAAVKRSYATTLVKTQAVRFGWRVSTAANGKMILQK